MNRSTRQLMLLLHLLLFLSGLSLVAMGTWVTAGGGGPFLHLLGPFSNQLLRFLNIGLLCIAMGTTLVLLGALGGCAAHWESKCLLLTFFSIVLIIFICETAAGVVALAYSSFAQGILKAWAVPALQNDYGSDPTVTGIWNYTMVELKCCGFSNYTDFLGSKVEEQNGTGLPPSCCSTNIAPCSPAEAARSPVQGCFDPILKTLRKHTCAVGGVAAGVGLLEIAAMIVSMYLFSHLDEKVS
ncbi:tetraspanin-1 [Xiphophorus couchianus]|uniref:tetraspanin-1 n=1 Tax=Xiphophorus couchianus TaxID=32473 RepID=UPI001015E359|nr:tetraspanin-1-like [Xiphophorus couchianus]